MLLQNGGAALDGSDEPLGYMPRPNLADKVIDDILPRRFRDALGNPAIYQDLDVPLGQGYEQEEAHASTRPLVHKSGELQACEPHRVCLLDGSGSQANPQWP